MARRYFWLIAASVTLTMLVATSAVLAVPSLINYQGKLTDSGGNPLDGSFSMTFRLYDAETGGTFVWNESQSVQVVDGIYSVELGSVSPFPADLFDSDSLYLEVIINGETLSPRQRLASTAFSMKAGDAETVAGLTPPEIVATSHGHDGSDITTGIVADARIASSIARDSEITWGNLADIPDDLADGDQVGVTTETDPTVPGWVKDGPDWAEISDVPAGLDDGDQVGISTEQDYGRSGVADNLYEGTSTLTNKYVNQSGDDMIGRLTTTVNSLGGGWTEAIKGTLNGASAIGAGVSGESNSTTGNGVYGGAMGSEGRGVYGGAIGTNGVGVYGEAIGSSGTGVKGQAPAGGWAGYFSGRLYASDRLGIGKTNPDHKLHVAGNAKFEVGGGSIAVTTPGGWPGVIAYSPNGHRRDIQYYNDFMAITMSDSSSPSQDTNGIRIYEDGDVAVKVLRITGGSDLCERFDVRGLKEDMVPSPGMVVSIDPDNPGELVVSTAAYDKRVAGIISGAGGVKPGMLMGQKGSKADGTNPVALTGRVYCWADAANGSIEPGDLLTTSNTPGHAMKVTDYSRAQGAVIGKAMSSLESGSDLVLVLVTLQ